MITPAIEELLEDLYIAETEAEGSRPESTALPETVTDALRNGWIEMREERPRLTAAGRSAGRDVVRRHRLAECLLHNVLRIASNAIHEDACRFEHVLLHGLDEKVCALLGHPAVCPHGKPIPSGSCCNRSKHDPIQEVRPLCDGKAGQQGAVAYLRTQDNREVQKLMAMGILPGVPIRLVRVFPSYIFEVGVSQFTVDRNLAEKIYVYWKDA